MKNFLTGAIATIWLLVATAACAQTPAKMPEGANVNGDAKLMADFKAKADSYLKLRKGLEGDTATPVQKTDDSKRLLQAQKELGAKVRAARVDANPGDFFTPATQALFRRLLSPQLKGSEGAENKSAIKDDAPEPKDIPFQVNAEYPRDETLSTVPPDVLRNLPVLPEGLQYRFVGRHLVLYDAQPGIIVDFMLNALPADVKPVAR